MTPHTITCNVSSGPGQGLEEGLGKTDKQEHSYRGPSTCKGSETKQPAVLGMGRRAVWPKPRSKARTAPRDWRSGLRTTQGLAGHANGPDPKKRGGSLKGLVEKRSDCSGSSVENSLEGSKEGCRGSGGNTVRS